MSKTVQPDKDTGPRPRRRKAGLASPQPPEGSAPRRRGDRRIELEWRRTHSLKAYSGQWVVLERDEIVAHGYDAGHCVEEARRKGIAIPYIFRVEPDYGENVARMGL